MNIRTQTEDGPARGKRGITVGIDLGTTFSAVAYVDEYGRPQIIPNAENERTTPSVILFDGSAVFVGAVASQNAMAEPEKTVDFVKREMGKTRAQFHREFDGVRYSAEQLSALIIKKLKADAEKYLREPVSEAVITVPAYFNDAERSATLRAGQLAGLNVLKIINEPTAAALAFGLNNLDREETVLAFDLGGGTFDVTIMRIEGNHLRIVGSNGDHRLGGKDWDDVILHWVVEEFEDLHGDNPLLDLQSYQEMQSRAVVAKLQLSARQRSTFVHSYNGRSVKVELTRSEFESRAKHLLERCKMICDIAVKQAALEWKDIDRILLTGGMTRMPSVRAMVGELAPGLLIDDRMNPDEAVALGAAIQGELLNIDRENAEVVVGSGEAPATPAAVGQMRVSEVATHTLGIVLWDPVRSEEYVFPMIPKATLLPIRAEHGFALARSNMKTAKVRVVEGESTLPADCTALGICEILLDESVAKGGFVKVSYSYNADQILEVQVEVAGKRATATINRMGELSAGDYAKAAADLFRMRVQ